MIIYIILCVSKMCNKSLKITYIKYKKMTLFSYFLNIFDKYFFVFLFCIAWIRFSNGRFKFIMIKILHTFYFVCFTWFSSFHLHSFLRMFVYCIDFICNSTSYFLHTSTNYICCCIWSSNLFHFILKQKNFNFCCCCCLCSLFKSAFSRVSH